MEPPADTDISLQRKRKRTNVTIGLIFLLSGIEYAVILPTVWMYLQSLDAWPFFLGLVLAAFSFTELLSGPVFGYWSDRTGKTKNIILLSNCFEIAGNFMYFVGISKWFLLGSRLVAGVGAGAGASIFGYLTRCSSAKERVPVFAMAMACRQAGLLIGPAFNIFLRYCTFQIGPFHVDKFSAPGIFMCALWTLMQFVVIFMFYDLPLNPLESPQHEHKPLLKQTDVQSPLYGAINCDHDPLSNQDDFSSMETANTSSVPVTNNHICSQSAAPNGTVKNGKPMIGLLREEVVVLLTAQFVTFFNQTALETLVTPLAQTYLGFEDLQNSLLYFFCGIEMLIGFLVVRALSRCCSDRILLAFGLLICNISCIWCLLFLAKPTGSYGFLLAEFVVGVFLQVLGLPFVSVSQVSLFSKVTAEKAQGNGHYIVQVPGRSCCIRGPIIMKNILLLLTRLP
ncbi:major facilitator superfamily domain-containing protein 8-like isoform X2 [Rhinoderma darwinii]|uniref:major facilitator superfamily domain-containing protein 8-like isoform X2 n=1 Tax=Rhinoderma darwinii TaxID=43563 RepID=UPI003F664DFC